MNTSWIAVSALAASIWLAPAHAAESAFLDGMAALKRHDYTQAFKLLTLATNTADRPIAAVILGTMLADGHGVPKDEAAAFRWFHTAAELDYPPAQAYAGRMLIWGGAPKRDPEQGIKWLRAAATAGDELGQLWLGLAYDQGLGVPKNTSEAFNWYLKAAEQGHPEAQWRTGMHLGSKYHVLRTGTPPNHAAAHRWFMKAAQQNYPDAQFQVGAALLLGRGALQDERQALEWLRKAAAQGQTDSYFFLGHAYLNGSGTPKDLVLSHVFFNLAAGGCAEFCVTGISVTAVAACPRS